ncbi:cell division protein ZipA [Pseudomonas azotoformans]|uniref:Cell division protein ZipA n=1 Tax=Pseudomonas azotoformans TaxID=47878 RepID=A0A1V2JGK4_PSEAZ|nr:ATP-binding protein [Pseudomonas azotoformans]OIN46081.1 cell division protein ZipA [Pseudomonas azotoformans]ONH44537.1 cell division protein ZipA [Pseudomonas azotoformans]SDN24298.1 Predicted kinase [Pseudomonas azotoformans]
MPTLHLLCGKIASGKSTLAKTLAAEHAAIVLCEDHWLATLYPGEILSIADYLSGAQRIRGVLGPLVINVLRSGVNVVLDFPANTLANREWLLGLAHAAQVPHCLHYLELDDATCRARLHARNTQGEHDFAATDAEFDLITRHFCVPSESEGLVIEWRRP